MGLLSSLGKSLSKASKSFTRTLGKTGNVFSSAFSFFDSTQADVEDAWDDYTGKSIAENNLAEQKRQFDLQNSLNERQFEYQQKLNAQQQEREDNAMVRKVNDLKNAGLNPVLAANGSGAPSAALSAPALKAPSAPQMGDYSGGVREGISSLLGLLTMKKNFAVQDAQIQKLNAEKGEIIASTAKAEAEAESIRIQNRYQGDLLAGKVTSQDLDNQLKSGTLQNNIDLVASKLSISKKEELIKDCEIMLNQADYDLKQIDIKIQHLVYDGKITENHILDKKLELLTEQVFKASIENENLKWDSKWYHDRNIPYGFNAGWVGQLGLLAGALGEQGANHIIDFFSRILGYGGDDSSDSSRPSKSQWKKALAKATFYPSSVNSTWSSIQHATHDYGVRRNH